MRFGADEEARVVRLSVRLIQVLHLLVKGMTNEEIARELRISFATVRCHVANLLSETGQRNRTSLTGWASARPDFLRTGVAVIGHHPRNCKCGFSDCPERKEQQ